MFSDIDRVFQYTPGKPACLPGMTFSFSSIIQGLPIRGAFFYLSECVYPK
ncbi:hypothetical protein VQ7734_00604 [Vibrio quintilis]|uniref:Uncharacterized protein n=1 Tax=Vibrio quintilis TaxID=1117707 RepID=A0A1M7YQS3_9VIBR|nr:hypothetical protein VQ7734_00604 [Vibrio quintilis]